MNIHLRRIQENDIKLLEDFLYEAIYLPEGTPPLDRSIIQHPDLQIYLTDFGKKVGDIGMFAVVDTQIVGAAWVRLVKDYGFIDKNTPSLAISLYKEFRGKGIGTILMKSIMNEVREAGFHQISLSVYKDNFAVKLYEKVGFTVLEERDNDYVMLCEL